MSRAPRTLIWLVYGECHESGACLIDAAYRSEEHAESRRDQLSEEQAGEATWWVRRCELDNGEGDNNEG